MLKITNLYTLIIVLLLCHSLRGVRDRQWGIKQTNKKASFFCIRERIKDRDVRINNFKHRTKGYACLLMLSPFSTTSVVLNCPPSFSELYWTSSERGVDASHLGYGLTGPSKLLYYNSV